MNRFWMVIAGCVIVSAASVKTADALPPFKSAFAKKYADGSKNEAFQAAVKKAGCFACHVKGAKSKKELNAYGHELHEELEKGGQSPKKLMKEDKEKLMKLLDAAFDSVAKKKSKKDGPTFGELIEKGELPAWKEVKKED